MNIVISTRYTIVSYNSMEWVRIYWAICSRTIGRTMPFLLAKPPIVITKGMELVGDRHIQIKLILHTQPTRCCAYTHGQC